MPSEQCADLDADIQSRISALEQKVKKLERLLNTVYSQGAV